MISDAFKICLENKKNINIYNTEKQNVFLNTF